MPVISGVGTARPGSVKVHADTVRTINSANSGARRSQRSRREGNKGHLKALPRPTIITPEVAVADSAS